MEVSLRLWTAISLLALSLQRVQSSLLTLDYRINDDCGPGTVLANIKTDFLRSVQYNSTVADLLRFVVLTTQSDARHHFLVNNITGLVLAARSLDRDDICPSAVDCLLNIDLAVQPPAYFQLIKVLSYCYTR